MHHHVNMSHLAKTFLRRADLKGAEVDQFGKVWNWLNEISIGDSVVLGKAAAEEYEQLLMEKAEAADAETAPDNSLNEN